MHARFPGQDYLLISAVKGVITCNYCTCGQTVSRTGSSCLLSLLWLCVFFSVTNSDRMHAGPQEGYLITMFSKSHLHKCWLAVVLLVGNLAGIRAVCKGDGNYACPAQDLITPVLEPYDPATVDWNAVVADVLAITRAEPRVCTMAIRAHFHDIRAHNGKAGDPFTVPRDIFPYIEAADASSILHNPETLVPHNSGSGFMQVVKHVIVQARLMCLLSCALALRQQIKQICRVRFNSVTSFVYAEAESLRCMVC
jgi:hypothetical protein